MATKKRKREDMSDYIRNMRNVNGMAGPSGLRNGYPNPDVRNIPCNETGTFIEKIFVPCQFCTKKFDRPDEYYLHHAEKHAKLYGRLNEEFYVTESNKDAKNNDCDVHNNTSDRKRRRSAYVNENVDISSSETDEEINDDDYETNEDNRSDNINHDDNINKPGVNLNDTEPKRKKKRSESESKEADSSKSLNSDDSGSDCEALLSGIMGLDRVRISVEKLTKKLFDVLKKKRESTLKNQRRLVYKCRLCSLHFLKESEWRKHSKSGMHSVEGLKCEHCMLKFSDEALPKHLKMHEKDGQIRKKIRLYIVTDNEVRSDTDDEEINNKPHSSPETLKQSTDQAMTEKVEKNKTETENVDNSNQGYSEKQVRSKKRFKAVLYKCDDCEVHFLTKKNVIAHTKNSTHYYSSEKNTICNICTIKFSGANTLSQHKKLHHNDRKNLTKEDFKIISWTKWTQLTYLNKKNDGTENQVQNKGSMKESFKKHLNKTLYRCEGCDVHFVPYHSWWSHLNRCKRTVSLTNVQKCLKCGLCFAKSSLVMHMKCHEENPTIMKHQFSIQSRKPRNYNSTVTHQANIVPMAEADVEIQKENSKSNVDSTESQSNVKGSKNTSESCKVTLTKTVAGFGQANGWRVVNNQEDSANVDKNSNLQISENGTVSLGDNRIINRIDEENNPSKEIETDHIESTVENANVTKDDFNSVTVSTGIEISYPTNNSESSSEEHVISKVTYNTKNNTERFVSLGNKNNEIFYNNNNVMVNIPSSFHESQNNTPEENFNSCTVDIAGVTLGYIVNNKMEKNETMQINHDNVDKKTDSNNETIKAPENTAIKNEFVKEEIKSENERIEPASSLNKELKNENSGRNCKTFGLKTEQQLKNDSFVDTIKSENIVSKEDLEIKNETSGKEITADNMKLNVELEQVKDGIAEDSTATDGSISVTQDNKVFPHIKIANSYSLRLKFEDDTQSCCEEPTSLQPETENQCENTDMQNLDTHVDNITQPETPPSTYSEFDEISAANNETDVENENVQLNIKKESNIPPDEDSESTIILVLDDEQTNLQEDTRNNGPIGENDVTSTITQNENIEIDKNKNRCLTEDKNLYRNQTNCHTVESNDDRFINKTSSSEAIIRDENGVQINENIESRIDEKDNEDAVTEKDNTVDISYFRTEILKIKEAETPKSIKVEKIDGQRTSAPLRREACMMDDNVEIIDLVEDDNVVILASIVIDDDD